VTVATEGVTVDYVRAWLPQDEAADRKNGTVAYSYTVKTLPYPIVGTGQAVCYDNWREIACPKAGEPFYGQDAQHKGLASNYVTADGGLTVLDRVTGLTWQRSPESDGNGTVDSGDKLTWAQVQARPAALNAGRFGGFDDWRLPTIKELYSLFDARGRDPSGPTEVDPSLLTPFIDATYFHFAFGDARAGERVIDAQFASSTVYAGSPGRGEKVFGVNFADGRIKGYDQQTRGGRAFRFFLLCVRGNPSYGKNDLVDNQDGTITDRATGLTWARGDSGLGMDWQDALAWVQKKNAERYLGHDDWRLPSVKELQSIVDYSRSPDTTRSAAIDSRFECTGITNETGQADYPFYWSSTTHVGLRGGAAAMYVAFGRASGWMSSVPGRGGPPPGGRGTVGTPPAGQPGPAAGEYRNIDVHGAGAQRSDPKTGDPAQFPHGRGPQGDVIRITNFVRLVRGQPR
jgi:hypothetical protein